MATPTTTPPPPPAKGTVRERLAQWAESLLAGAAAGIPVAASATSVPEVIVAAIAGNMAVQAAMTLVGGPGVGERIISWGQETAEALEELAAQAGVSLLNWEHREQPCTSQGGRPAHKDQTIIVRKPSRQQRSW